MTNASDLTPIWQHLLLANIAPDDALTAMKNVLENAGYASYDPFPGGSGAPIGKRIRIRAFAAPPSPNWQSIFIAPNDHIDTALLTNLAQSIKTPFVDLRLLSLEEYQITVYEEGSTTTDLAGLVPFLKSGLSLSDIETARHEPPSSVSNSPSSSNLPSELQQFADQQGVQSKHVDKLMGRMTKRIFKKMEKQSGDASDTTQEQAKAMLAGQAQDLLNTPAGQTLCAMMNCLNLPDDWYLPEWKSLVAAYPIARQQQKGNALLLPGDEAALQQVPNALDFTPIYYAKSNT